MHSFTDFEANCDLRGDLHGYCSEDTKSFLLWKQRLEIMLRAAQGLAYLHELQVIYGDFKS
ncbi:hypothetical protein F2Q70_00041007 [Brassica cretica]|uniref:Protein kinase domain-containing protein n=1 Tax=Brassica cretica TaxID=69181 RepID=A0A8S9K8X1_BRACR|nr:hypothetical protein F2Q70_00041007 [Brassica cretica]